MRPKVSLPLTPVFSDNTTACEVFMRSEEVGNINAQDLIHGEPNTTYSAF